MKNLIDDALAEKGVKAEDARICILGFSYIEDSDDTRNTPALPLYNSLRKACKQVVVHDPYVKKFDEVKLSDDLAKAVKNKNCVAIVTRHKEYSEIDLDWLKNRLATPVIVDGRNTFNPAECIEKGFAYRGVGVGLKQPKLKEVFKG
jgi:UDP-N-acetyl-D-mannosaminuronic acid dehydrogenase